MCARLLFSVDHMKRFNYAAIIAHSDWTNFYQAKLLSFFRWIFKLFPLRKWAAHGVGVHSTSPFRAQRDAVDVRRVGMMNIPFSIFHGTEAIPNPHAPASYNFHSLMKLWARKLWKIEKRVLSVRSMKLRRRGMNIIVKRSTSWTLFDFIGKSSSIKLSMRVPRGRFSNCWLSVD